MKVLTFKLPYPLLLPYGHVAHLDAGGSFVFADQHAHDLMSDFGDGGNLFEAREIDVDERPPLMSAWDDWRGDVCLDRANILWVRVGGIGDVLFLTPLLRHFRQTWKTRNYVSTATGDVLRGNADVHRIAAYPVPFQESDVKKIRMTNERGMIHSLRYAWERFDYHADFEGWEHSPDGQTMCAVDVCARWVGVTLADKRMRIELLSDEIAQAHSIVARLGAKRKGETWVAFQPRASSDVRSWSRPKVVEFTRRMVEKGYSTLMVGSMADDLIGIDRHQCLFSPSRFINLAGRVKDVKVTAAVLSLCDVVVAPDSSITHIANALNVPTVSLYGSFNPALRIDAPRNLTLYGKAAEECWKGTGIQQGCNVQGERFLCGNKCCKALDAIEVDDVIQAVEDALRGESGVRAIEQRTIQVVEGEP